MSIGRMQRQKARKHERKPFQIRQYERQLAMLQGQQGYVGVSHASFISMPWWLRLRWLLTGHFDASRILRDQQAAAEASAPIAAAA